MDSTSGNVEVASNIQPGTPKPLVISDTEICLAKEQCSCTDCTLNDHQESKHAYTFIRQYFYVILNIKSSKMAILYGQKWIINYCIVL